MSKQDTKQDATDSKPRTRKSKAGPNPPLGMFLRERPDGKVRFVPGRDATLAGACRRILKGNPRDAGHGAPDAPSDADVVGHRPLVTHHTVAESAYLAPLVAKAQQVLKGAPKGK